MDLNIESGSKIGIKFTDILKGDVTGYFPKPIGKGDAFSPIGTATASSIYSSSYPASNAFNGNTSNQWYTRTAGTQWIQIDLDEPKYTSGFKWYVSSYPPANFIFKGSNDGVDWFDIIVGTSPNVSGRYHEFECPVSGPFKFYRWEIISRYSSYLYIYDIQLFRSIGQEGAFTVTGKEYPYVNGPLIDKEYKVDKVERYGVPILWKLPHTLELDSTSIIESFETDQINPFLKLTGTWSRSTKTFYEGKFALESSNKSNSSSSDAYLSFTSEEGKNFSIAYRVSSESNYDKFYLYHNGVVKINGISGAGNWLKYSGVTTEGENILRARYTKDGSTSRNLDAAFIDYFYLQGEYISPKVYVSDCIEINGEYRIKWASEEPEGTSIKVEVTTGVEQNEWFKVDNGEIITLNKNAWISVTLTSIDPFSTPTLSELRFEEIEIPEDTIRLKMDPLSRFNNVQGPLSISYDAMKGTLSGRGGAVGPFNISFLPMGLLYKPNPNPSEYIIIKPLEFTATFPPTNYVNCYTDEFISMRPEGITISFLDVEEINP